MRVCRWELLISFMFFPANYWNCPRFSSFGAHFEICYFYYFPQFIFFFLCDFCQSTFPVSISRVNQVDAARLDVEMSAMLKEQLVKVFSLMKVSFPLTSQ